MRQGLEFLRAGHQSVGLAERMVRNRVAPQIGFVGMPLEQRAASEQAAIAVAAGARQDDLALGRGEDGLEIPTVGGADRQRIELGGRDDVVGEQPVLGDPARPARGIEPQEANEAAGRCRKRAGRHPGHGDAGVQTVILLERLQRHVERGGRAGEQRLAPDGERATGQEGGAESSAAATLPSASMETMSRSAGPWSAPSGQSAAPKRSMRRVHALGRSERRIGRQNARPALRQRLKRAGIGRQQRRKPPHPRLRQAAHQDVGQRRGRLSFPAGRDLHAMDEMKVEIGVGAQREEVIVVVGRIYRSDGDV